MGRKKTSIIWEIPKDEFQRIVDESSFVVDILKYFSLPEYNGNHKTFHARVKQDNISLDKFIKNHKQARKKLMKVLNTKRKMSDDEFFVKGVYRNNTQAKKRLIQSGSIEQCAECGNTGEYNNKPLSLQLDHINGDSQDHRRDNLRFLCPNCHSQTKTFSGKNISKYIAPKDDHFCPKCGEKYAGYGNVCVECIKRDTVRPQKEVLKALIWEKTLRDIGKDYGVSDVAVRKWCDKYELECPPRGYWLKSGVSKEI